MASDAGDEMGCVNGYPEHLYEFMQERDGYATYRCTRCDAEMWEEVALSATEGADDAR